MKDAAEVGRAVVGVSRRTAVRVPLAAFRGFQRGLLAGGTLRRFFDEVLPRADLSLDALAPALSRGRADPGAELRAPLTEAVEALHDRWLEAHDQQSTELSEARRDAAENLYAPLAALRDAVVA